MREQVAEVSKYMIRMYLSYAPTFLKALKYSNVDTYCIGIYGICPQVSTGSVCACA